MSAWGKLRVWAPQLLMLGVLSGAAEVCDVLGRVPAGLVIPFVVVTAAVAVTFAKKAATIDIDGWEAAGYRCKQCQQLTAEVESLRCALLTEKET